MTLLLLSNPNKHGAITVPFAHGGSTEFCPALLQFKTQHDIGCLIGSISVWTSAQIYLPKKVIRIMASSTPATAAAVQCPFISYAAAFVIVVVCQPVYSTPLQSTQTSCSVHAILSSLPLHLLHKSLARYSVIPLGLEVAVWPIRRHSTGKNKCFTINSPNLNGWNERMRVGE